MSTYTQLHYHIVFSTKYREPVLTVNAREDLYRYIAGFVKEKQGHLHRVNGIEDHIHLLAGIHQTIAVADFIRGLKTATATWMKASNLFPGFRHWKEGYGAFTVSYDRRDHLIKYIKNQAEHHRVESPVDEFRRLLEEAGIKFDERYLE